MFFEVNQVYDLLSCEYCRVRLDIPFILPCGKIICSVCSAKLIDSKKDSDFECVSCQSRHKMPEKEFPICEMILNLLSTPSNDIYRGYLAEELKSNLNEIDSQINEFKLELNHSDDVIREHCMSLRNQVQLSTESYMLQISKFNESLIERINSYERELLDKLNNNKDMQNKFDVMLNELDQYCDKYKSYLNKSHISDEVIAKANELASTYKETLKYEKYKLNDLIFSGKLMKFSSNTIKLEPEVLGWLQIHGTQASINYNELKKIQVENILYDYNSSFEDSININAFDDSTFFILYKKLNKDFRYFTLNSEKSREQYLYITNGTILSLKKVKNLMILNYNYAGDSFIKTFDQKLQQINTENLTRKYRCNLNIVGANFSHLVGITSKPFNHVYIFNSQLDLIRIIGDAIDSQAKYYFPLDLKQLEFFNGRFIWLDSSSLNIVDEKTGSLLKKINLSADKFEIDIYDNLVLFSRLNKLLIYYNLDGMLMKEVTLNEFPSDFSFFINKIDNKITFFDKNNLTISF